MYCLKIAVIAALVLFPLPAWCGEREAEAEQDERMREHIEREEHVAHMLEQQGGLRAEIEEMAAHLKEAPPEISEPLRRCIELTEALADMIGENVDAHREGQPDAVHETDAEIEDIERERAFAQLELEKAHMIHEIEIAADDMGVGEHAKPLLDQVEQTFVEARELLERSFALQKEQAQLKRKREIIWKRLEILMLEAQVDRPERSLGEG